MARYKIIHREELVDEFYVEACSEEEALKEYEHAVEEGWINFDRMEMVDSSNKVELIED